MHRVSCLGQISLSYCDAVKKLNRTSGFALFAVVWVGVLLGRSARPIIEGFESVAPTVGWAPGLALGLGAAVLGVLAWSTHSDLHRNNRVMHASRGLRLLALAKSSAVVGALFCGAYAGYALAFVSSFDTPFGQDRVLQSIFAALAGAGVMIAALFLEKALITPGGSDEAGSSAETSAA